MSYSRRQLYALGEPLGDSATYRKADGGFILGDGGGGSSQPANTTSTTTQTAELPEWARGYAKETLAKGQALTDVNQNPYQQYTQPRIAGFSPMQQQAMQTAANMTVAPQVAQGSGLAYGAGLGGLGMAMGATPQNFQSQVGGYMNPYLQMALAPQIAEANRQYDIGATKQQSAATQAGAFGGAREAIMAAENERNRNMALQNIVGQGYNQAYNQAQNQYNQAQQQALQGLGVGLQGAGQLGQLGQQQYQQGMGINQLQAQYGGQQQALQQQGLTQAYQDFINQQNYPYKQLGFMSDLIRGLPLGQQSTASVYQPPGSVAGQIAGLGVGALGLTGLAKTAGFAEGGDVYAGGGQIDSAGNIASILSKLSDQQLQQAKQAALGRRDVEEADLIDQEMAHRASMRTGIASTPINADEMASDENPESITGYAVGGSAVEALMNKPKEPEQSMKDAIAEQYATLETKNAPLLESLRADAEAQKGQAEEIKARGLNEALAQYGFGWAAKAARPGARFLGSASEASPILAESAMNTQKAITAARDKYNDLKSTQTKYQIALNQGNMRDAIQQANIMRQEKRDQKTLELTAAKYADDFKIHSAQVAAMASHQGSPILQIADRLKKEGDPAVGEELLKKAANIAGAASIYGATSRGNTAYMAQLEKIEDQYKMIPYLKEGSPERKRMEDERDRRIRAIEHLKEGAPQPSGSISSALPQGGSMRDKGFKVIGTE